MITRLKKIGILLFAILTAAVFLAVFIVSNNAFANNSNTENLKRYIGEEKAKEIALSDAGVSKADATYLHAHLDRDDRVIDYDVEFYSGGKEYDYEINAYTGAIIEKSSEVERVPDYGSQQSAPAQVPSYGSQSAAAAANTQAPAVNTQPSAGTYYDDDYYDDDWDDRYDDYDDRYDDDWDDRYDDYDDDWDDRYDDD